MEYTSFEFPQLEYASTVWGPHTANNSNQIEAVQRRAAQSVMNDWSRPHSLLDVHLAAKEVQLL